MAIATAPPAVRNWRGGPRRTPDYRPRTRSRKRLRNWLLFAVLAGPNIALLVVFTYRPLLGSSSYSTLQWWNIGSPTATPVGLGNYADRLADPDTPRTIAATTGFTLATVGGGMVLGLLLAVLLNRKPRFRGTARTIVVAAYVLSGVAVGLLWLLVSLFVFDPNFGVLSAPSTSSVR